MAQIRAYASLLFGRAGAAEFTSHSHALSNAAAPSGFPLQWLAAKMSVLDSFSLLANLQRYALVSPPAISVSIPHACSSNTTPVSRRAMQNLVSWFSRAAIFPRTIPLPGVAALVPRALTPGYRALAPNGAAQGILLVVGYLPLVIGR